MVYLSKNLKNAIKYVKIHFINIVTAIFMTGSILIKKKQNKKLCSLCCASFQNKTTIIFSERGGFKEKMKEMNE